MALITAQDYIVKALGKCGNQRPGYTPQVELLQEGLDDWQALYDGYNAQRTMSYSVPDYIYPIGSNTGLAGIYGPNVQFSIGPAFTFSATLTIGNAAAPCPNTAGLNIGQSVSGTGIPANTTISSLAVNTSVTFSHAATVSGAQTITVTPSFFGPRPESIIRMNLWMTTSNPTHPARVPIRMIGAEEWANLPILQFTPINIATTCYYDPQFPQGVLNVFPPLNENALEIFTWGFLMPPTSLASTYSAPPGYADVIIWELAKRMWPRCTHNMMANKVSHQWLCGQASRARADVKRVNAPMNRLRNDFSGGGHGRRNASDLNLLLTGIPY